MIALADTEARRIFSLAVWTTYMIPAYANTARKRHWWKGGGMIEVVCNDRLGKKVRVKCNSDDTIGDLKKLIAAQTGTRAEKIRLQKWYNIYKDHITLEVPIPAH